MRETKTIRGEYCLGSRARVCLTSLPIFLGEKWPLDMRLIMSGYSAIYILLSAPLYWRAHSRNHYVLRFNAEWLGYPKIAAEIQKRGKRSSDPG